MLIGQRLSLALKSARPDIAMDDVQSWRKELAMSEHGKATIRQLPTRIKELDARAEGDINGGPCTPSPERCIAPIP